MFFNEFKLTLQLSPYMGVSGNKPSGNWSEYTVEMTLKAKNCFDLNSLFWSVKIYTSHYVHT